MVYVDTSALVPMFVREARSDALLDWLEGSGASLAVSDWALLEFASAIALKVRTGVVSAGLGREAIAHVQAFVEEHCTVATPRREEFRRAARLVSDGRGGLRAGDALHIAIAESLDAKSMLCLDATLTSNARAVGIDTVQL